MGFYIAMLYLIVVAWFLNHMRTHRRRVTVAELRARQSAVLQGRTWRDKQWNSTELK